jgi:uncharacterized MnhB-related membrane protein
LFPTPAAVGLANKGFAVRALLAIILFCLMGRPDMAIFYALLCGALAGLWWLAGALTASSRPDTGGRFKL